MGANKYGYNPESEHDTGGHSLIPDGTRLRLRIEDVEEKSNSTGWIGLDFKLAVVGSVDENGMVTAKHKGRKIFNLTTVKHSKPDVQKIGQGQLHNLVESCGIDKRWSMLSQFCGLVVDGIAGIKIGSTKPDGTKYDDRNRIKWFEQADGVQQADFGDGPVPTAPGSGYGEVGPDPYDDVPF